jgi:hypothetical protein
LAGGFGYLLVAEPSLNFPMMDWTGTSKKAKRNQHLSAVAKRHAVPTAVLIDF